MKTLLVPVDFSSATDRVVAEAATLARAFEGKVVLLHITEPMVTIVDYAVVNFSTARVNDAMVKAAVARLSELEQELGAGGVTASSVHAIGSPVPEITDQAEKLSADYIVVGSHGHTAFYDLVVGSTTGGVLKRATCPVIVVPPAATRHAGATEVAKEEVPK